MGGVPGPENFSQIPVPGRNRRPHSERWCECATFWPCLGTAPFWGPADVPVAMANPGLDIERNGLGGGCGRKGGRRGGGARPWKSCVNTPGQRHFSDRFKPSQKCAAAQSKSACRSWVGGGGTGHPFGELRPARGYEAARKAQGGPPGPKGHPWSPGCGALPAELGSRANFRAPGTDAS